MKGLKISKEKPNYFWLCCETYNLLPDQSIPTSMFTHPLHLQELTCSFLLTSISPLWEPTSQIQWLWKSNLVQDRRPDIQIGVCYFPNFWNNRYTTEKIKYIFCVYLKSLSVDINGIKIWKIFERQKTCGIKVGKVHKGD